MRSPKLLGILLTFFLLIGPALVEVADAAVGLLVNTESFQTIDEGDGSSNLEIRFGSSLNEKILYDRSNNRFQFTRGIYVGGSITATGSLTTGGPAKIRGNLSGSTLRVDGNADVWGTLSATGAIKTKSDLTINSDADTNDASLIFGNQTANQTLKFLNSAQQFEFSKSVRVTGNVKAAGNLSGSTLTVDGNVSLRGQAYQFPSDGGNNNQFLRTNGAGALTWSTVTMGSNSGGVLSLHPEYPGAVYFGSGSNAVGTLVYNYDAANLENYYRWSSSKAQIQDYWVAVRAKVPKNFANWDPHAPVEVRLRTTSTSATNNLVTVRMYDTSNALVATSGNASLTSSSGNVWRTAPITNVTGGTYAVGGYVTLLIKMAALSGNTTDLGYINFNWSTTTP